MAVTLINSFEIEPSAEPTFIERWSQTAASFARQPGFLGTRLHRALDPGARFRFVNVARWESADSWSQAIRVFPPRERGLPGVSANPALYQAAPGGTIEADHSTLEVTLLEIEDNLAVAYQNNDMAFLDRVLADSYVVTDGPGTASDKRKVLADHAAKRLRATDFHFDERRVERLGSENALVTGQYTWQASYDGHPIDGTFRYLRVYEREGHSWRIRAGQVTPVLQRRT